MITEDQQRDLDVLMTCIPIAVVRAHRGIPFSLVEDGIIKILAGKKTSEHIACMLGRSQQGITKRIGQLGLNGRLTGDCHQGAKLSNLQVKMLCVLHAAGFNVSEIHKCCFPGMSYNGVLAALKKRGAI